MNTWDASSMAIVILLTLISLCCVLIIALQLETLKRQSIGNKPDMPSTSAIKQMSGVEAPPIVARWSDGSIVPNHIIQGKETVLVFFASFCGPCKASMPMYISIAQQAKSKGIELIRPLAKVSD